MNLPLNHRFRLNTNAPLMGRICSASIAKKHKTSNAVEVQAALAAEH